MSINVTVSGNPVKIHRGKMVCQDTNNYKKDLEKRRLERLQQVREQNKQFSEQIRNNVRKEKSKLLNQIEKQGKEDCKKRQARKLLELQTQKEEAIKDLGIGHKDARRYKNENKLLERQREDDERLSKKRGQEAVKKLRSQQADDQSKDDLRKEQQRMNREMENIRAALISQLEKKPEASKRKKQKRKKNVTANININGVSNNDSVYDPVSEEVPELQLESSSESSDDSTSSRSVSSKSSSSPSFIEQSNAINRDYDSEKHDTMQYSASEKYPGSEQKQSSSSTVQTNEDTDSAKEQLYKQTLSNRPEETKFSETETKVSVYRNTTISDRIKSRNQSLFNPRFTNGNINSCTCNFHSSHSTCNCNLTTQKPLTEQSYRRPFAENVHILEHPVPAVENNAYHHPNFKSSHDFGCQYSFQETVSRPVQTSCSCYKLDKQLQVDQHIRSDHQTETSGSGRTEMITKTLWKGHNNRVSSSSGKPSVEIYHKDEELDINEDRYTLEKRTKNVSFEDIPNKPKVTLVKNLEPIQKRTSQINSGTERQKSNVNSSGTAGKKDPTTTDGRAVNVGEVERVTDDNLIISAMYENGDVDYYDKIHEQDYRAQKRGEEALRKEKIIRDSEKLKRNLPHLKKKERICDIGNDKPEYHMTEERLKERERKRQNKMENTYEREFLYNRKPAVVLIPPKVPEVTPFRIADDDDVATLNVGHWDSDFPLPPAKLESNPDKGKTEQLHEIMRKLEEIRKPLSENIPKVLSPLPENFSKMSLDDSAAGAGAGAIDEGKTSEKTATEVDPHKTRSRNRERSKHKRSIGDIEENSRGGSQRSLSREEKLKKRHEKCFTSESAVSTTSSSPRKKLKVKHKHRIVVQNTGTQTQSDSVKLKETLEKSVCVRTEKPCDCHLKSQPEDLVQVVIKVSEEKEPEIVVHSASEGSKIEIVKKSISETTSNSKSKTTSVPFEPENIKPQRPLINKENKIKSQSESSENNSSQRQTGEKVTFDMKKLQTKTRDESNKKYCWKDELNKNSSEDTATSYYSPPDLVHAGASQNAAPDSQKNRLKLQNKDYLLTKPQQGNKYDWSTTPQSAASTSYASINDNDNTFMRVRKLTTMSRKSIEDLGVSTISEVSTPNDSVIEISTNKSAEIIESSTNNKKYHSVLDKLTISSISNGSSFSNADNNFSISSSNLVDDEHKLSRLSKSITIADEVCRPSTCRTKFSDAGDALLKRTEKRIEKLQQLYEIAKDSRIKCMEKSYSSNSDRSDQSPNVTACSVCPNKDEDDQSNNDNSEYIKTLTKQLLQVHYDSANNNLSSSKSDINKSSDPDDSGNELMARLQKLKGPETHGNISDTGYCLVDNNANNAIIKRPNEETQTDNGSGDIPFVPMLKDIPKLPILPFSEALNENGNNHKRPPVSKGLSFVSRVTPEVSIRPHELSTIVEADSQMSIRTISLKSSKGAKKMTEKNISSDGETSQIGKNLSDLCLQLNKSSDENILMRRKDYQEAETIVSQIDRVFEKIKSKSEQNSPTAVRKSMSRSNSLRSDSKSSSTSISDESLKRHILNYKKEQSSNVPVPKNENFPDLSSKQESSSSEIPLGYDKAMHEMLQDMGLHWAGSTMKRTAEALALSSSSSSSSVRKNQSKFSLSSSSANSKIDIAISDRKLKLATSSLKSNSSITSLVENFEDLSSIKGSKSGSFDSSTPLLLKDDEGSKKFKNLQFEDPKNVSFHSIVSEEISFSEHT